jgi:hypothetical protein
MGYPIQQVVQGERFEHMAVLLAGWYEGQRELLRLRFTDDLGAADFGVLFYSSNWPQLIRIINPSCYPR